jgi:hypothetical protein
MEPDQIKDAIEGFDTIITGMREELRQAQVGYQNAGVASSGDYLNKIKEFNSKIRQAEKEKKILQDELMDSVRQEKLFIFVISSTKQKVEPHLGQDLIKLVPQGTYSVVECSDWQPYEIEPVSVKQLIGSMRDNYGFGDRIIDVYLDGCIDTDLRVAIDLNRENTIAIVDLLAIHKDNEKTVALFNTTSIFALIIPFSRRLNAELQTFMEGQRSRIFDIPEGIYARPDLANFYNGAVAEQREFTKTLYQVVGRRLRIKNAISDKTSKADSDIKNSAQRVINP